MQAGKWWFIAVAGLALLFGDARADSPDSGWQLSFPYSLSALESHQWVYGGRIRYRFTERHKFGVENVGLVDDPGSPSLMLGYYGRISSKLSIKLVAGASIESWRERTARAELVWQIN